MSLAPGVRLGAYEIIALIGSGGMGEVYRARDTRLSRTVAIKILQEKHAGDPQFKERFQREAHAISSLEHPNICALYDVGEHEGAAFLVMQHLDGETLEARLQRGALPLEAALQHAIEIADALDQAHRHGVVHRDLKPGNIMLTKAGAKLLDFGLAKATTRSVAEGLSTLPTTPENLTAHGIILGTFRYMAPEQLEGGDADVRTDIFAFGAVVYEMLTGHRAFEGKSQASLIAAILDHEPPPLSSTRESIPRLVDHIVRRCLAKNPEERWQSARDLRDELQWVMREQLQPADGSQARASGGPTRRRAAAVLAIVCVAVSAAAVAFFYMRTPAVAGEMRFDISAPAPHLSGFALSPDGTRLVAGVIVNDQRQLWLRLLESGLWQPLPGTEGARLPFWSPDSRSVGFFAAGKLKTIDVQGGVPRELTDASPRGGTWNADGVIVFAPNPLGSLARVRASGGQPIGVTKPPAQGFHLRPTFLPDGEHFIFYATGPPDTRGIYLASLGEPNARRLVASDGPGVYATSGWLLFQHQGAIRAQRFDTESSQMAGHEVAVANAALSDLSTSAAGLIAYRAGSRSRTHLVWVDRSGKTLGTFGPVGDAPMLAPRLSPDGHRVAMFSARDVVLIDEGRITRFTFDAALERYPIWSPDGGSIVFDSDRHKGRHLFSSSNPGAEELVLETPQAKTANDWSPDGRHILFQSNDPKSGIDLWVWPRDPNRKPYVFLQTGFNERRASFSPDGRWVIYLSNQSGSYEVWVRPFIEPGASASGARANESRNAWQISTKGGIQPRWNPNGQEVHYIAPDGNLMAVPIKVAGSTLQPGPAVALFQPRVMGLDEVDAGLQYDIASDGRFLLNSEIDDSSPITVIVNWTPPLE
jgi:eukaryotic-like serine/threonine-protein kinase